MLRLRLTCRHADKGEEEEEGEEEEGGEEGEEERYRRGRGGWRRW
jgi:hypothetical protein